MTAFDAYVRTLRTRYNQQSFLTADEIELMTIINEVIERGDNSVIATLRVQPSERNKRILARLGYKVEYSSISWDNFGMEDLT